MSHAAALASGLTLLAGLWTYLAIGVAIATIIVVVPRPGPLTPIDELVFGLLVLLWPPFAPILVILAVEWVLGCMTTLVRAALHRARS